MTEQRQDVFDPHGQADWGARSMGGFLTGQNNVSEAQATEKEMKQKLQRNVVVKKLKASGVFGRSSAG